MVYLVSIEESISARARSKAITVMCFSHHFSFQLFLAAAAAAGATRVVGATRGLAPEQKYGRKYARYTEFKHELHHPLVRMF